MIKTKNLLASLRLEIPVLETNQEGQLRGGFNAFGVSSATDSMNGNCNCNCGCNGNGNCNCNCGCNGNGNCNCNCGCDANNNCYTCTPSVTSEPTVSSLPTGVASATILFDSLFML